MSKPKQVAGLQESIAIPLYSDESVADLSRDGLRLIQPRQGFRFGEDTVLLADFAASLFDSRPLKAIRVADLGAGSGASAILLAARLHASCILAVELESHSFSALERNRRLNHLEARLDVIQSDYSQWPLSRPAGPDGSNLQSAFDLVIANPPYGLSRQSSSSGRMEKSHPNRQSAREEQTMTLDALIRTAAWLLRPHGQLALVYRTNRLTDVLTALRSHQIEPKSLRLIQSVENRPPSRFMIAAVNQARPGSLVAKPPLVVRDSSRQLTQELVRIYGNSSPMTSEAMLDGLRMMDSPWQPHE